jgi:stage V sporulation protein G
VKITEIRVKLVLAPPEGGEKLKAFCSVTLDNEIVIRDVKVIEGNKGLFIAMPSRRLTVRCPKCSGKNPVRSRFCNDCGARQRAREAESEEPAAGRRLYADVAHPIHARARQKLEHAVLAAFDRESRAARRLDYVPPEFVDLDYDDPDQSLRRPRTREAGSAGGEAGAV